MNTIPAPDAATREQRAEGVRQAALPSGGSQYTGTSEYAVTRVLRTDRILMAVGVGAAVAAIVILRRSRR